MRLKCIAGECDGQMIEVDDPKINRPINVVKPIEARIIDDTEALTSTVTYYIYKVTCFHFDKDNRMLFLIPHDWTNEEAVRWQFSK